MPIDDNSILQTDATVIAGVLILLTIATVGEELTRIFSSLFTLMFTVVAIFPFATSSLSSITSLYFIYEFGLPVGT